MVPLGTQAHAHRGGHPQLVLAALLRTTAQGNHSTSTTQDVSVHTAGAMGRSYPHLSA